MVEIMAEKLGKKKVIEKNGEHLASYRQYTLVF